MRGVVGRVGLLYFFFSSRRRHTRLQGDWSSDVCSSDLQRLGVPALLHQQRRRSVRKLRLQAAEVILADRRGVALLGATHPQLIELERVVERRRAARHRDRKSTRLNSSHLVISYAVFCLKKKKEH